MEELSKISQGPDEPYQNFVSCLLKVVSHLMVDGETKVIVVKQLTYGNAYDTCQIAIDPIFKKKKRDINLHPPLC